jgi:hypothetical protein
VKAKDMADQARAEAANLTAILKQGGSVVINGPRLIGTVRGTVTF